MATRPCSILFTALDWLRVKTGSADEIGEADLRLAMASWVSMKRKVQDQYINLALSLKIIEQTEHGYIVHWTRMYEYR